MTFIHLIRKICILAEDLENESDDRLFDSGKEELLRLLDVSIHTHGSIDVHYEDSVRSVLKRMSLTDIKLDERIIKGGFVMKIAAGELDSSRVIKCFELLETLKVSQLNRRWGIRGIYY